MASSSSFFFKALAPRAYALSARAPLFRLSALTRSSHVVAMPRRLFPCDMLLARNASTAAMQARMPPSLYANEEAASSAAPPKDGQQPFSTVADKLHPHTLKAIKHTNMSVVQSRIFPLLPHLAEPHDPIAQVDSNHPRDLLVKAKTGTGKTMAFLVPAIEARVKAIDAHVARAHANSGLGEKWSKTDALRAAAKFASDNVGTLILSPTRELATQIAVEAANLTVHHKGFQVQVLLGGESKGRQIGSWERGRKDIVVATPGRMMDLLDSVPMFSEALANTKIVIFFILFYFITPCSIFFSSFSTRPTPCLIWASNLTSKKFRRSYLHPPNAKPSFSAPQYLGKSRTSQEHSSPRPTPS